MTILEGALQILVFGLYMTLIAVGVYTMVRMNEKSSKTNPQLDETLKATTE